MIIDSSALVAVAFNEPETEPFARLMTSARVRIGAPTVLEAAHVLRPALGRWLDTVLADLAVEIVDFSSAHAAAARQAMATYGRGTGHPASLDFGDCMSYAVAKVAGEPLLFKGDDFTHTDIEPAWSASA